MKSKKNSEGITLISLIVTVIVIMILALVSIAMLTGENSIIRRAFAAKEATNEAEARERVELEIAGSFDRRTGNLDPEELKENLQNNLGIQEHQIQEGDDGSLDFPLGDYDIHITPEGKTESLPAGEIPTPPQLEDSDITFNPEPSTLTNGEVKVGIKVNVSTMRLTLQYATSEPDSEDSWQTYTGPVT